jgi:protein-disulfide isomerase
MQDNPPRDRGSAARFGLIAALVLAAAGAGWAAAKIFPGSSISAGDRKVMESVVRDYLLENPEVLPEAMEALQRKEDAKQLASISEEVHTPYPGAVLGNPKGKVTLVEFSDFACGYCRKSVADIEALIAQNPDLRVVIRELPILSEHSVEAARMSLAAAEQGKFAEFHRAMFAAGQPGPATIAAAARQAGLDMEKARSAAQSPRVQQELDRNLEFARQLGFSGTPSWVAGDQLIGGAVGAEELAKALEAASRS